MPPDDNLAIAVIVVSAADRLDLARRLLDDLGRQTRAPSEVRLVLQETAEAQARVADLGAAPGLGLTVLANADRSLSRARNLAVAHLESDVVVFMDDDARMPAASIERIADGWSRHRDAGIVTFRAIWTGAGRADRYPPGERRLWSPRSVTHVASIEMTVAVDLFRSGSLAFDERFGLGGPYPTGEEYVLITDVLRAGREVAFVPAEISEHPASTSGLRLDRAMLRSKGAVFARVFGWRGLAAGYAFVGAKVLRRQLGCPIPAALRAVTIGWREFPRRVR